jgi:hypothetical protein
MDLSKKHPDMIYTYMDSFIDLLDSEHRILKWNALAIIANLKKVDVDLRFDTISTNTTAFLTMNT